MSGVFTKLETASSRNNKILKINVLQKGDVALRTKSKKKLNNFSNFKSVVC